MTPLSTGLRDRLDPYTRERIVRARFAWHVLSVVERSSLLLGMRARLWFVGKFTNSDFTLPFIDELAKLDFDDLPSEIPDIAGSLCHIIGDGEMYHSCYFFEGPRLVKGGGWCERDG